MRQGAGEGGAGPPGVRRRDWRRAAAAGAAAPTAVHVEGAHAGRSRHHAQARQALDPRGAHGAVVTAGGHHHLGLDHVGVLRVWGGVGWMQAGGQSGAWLPRSTRSYGARRGAASCWGGGDASHHAHLGIVVQGDQGPVGDCERAAALVAAAAAAGRQCAAGQGVLGCWRARAPAPATRRSPSSFFLMTRSSAGKRSGGKKAQWGWAWGGSCRAEQEGLCSQPPCARAARRADHPPTRGGIEELHVGGGQHLGEEGGGHEGGVLRVGRKQGWDGGRGRKAGRNGFCGSSTPAEDTKRKRTFTTTNSPSSSYCTPSSSSRRWAGLRITMALRGGGRG